MGPRHVATIGAGAWRLLLPCFACLLLCAVRGSYASKTSPESELEAFTNMRRLMQDDPDANAEVFVSSPRELETAILQGQRHIVVTAHLDLTALPLRDTTICPDGCASPLPEIRETMSIRGNCSAPPTDIELAVLTNTPGAAALLPFNKDQCLIMSHDDLFPALSYRLWYDNLYMRAVFHNLPEASREYHYIGLAGMAPLKWPLRGRGARYISRVTIQGDGVGPTMGIWADESVYAENCTFANLGGDGFSDACDVCSAAVIAVNATITVVNSTFFDPLPMNGTAYVRAWGGGQVLLSGCEFAATPTLRFSPFYAYDNATIFSADGTLQVRSDADGTIVEPTPPSAIPATPASLSTKFLRRNDPWFVSTRNLLNVALPQQPAYPAPAGSVARLDVPAAANQTRADDAGAASVSDGDVDGGDGGGDGGLPVGAIVAIAAVAALFLLILAALALFARRQRQQKHRIASKAEGYPGGGPEAAALAPPSAASDATSSAVGFMAATPWDKGSVKSISSLGHSLNSVPSHAAAGSISSAAGATGNEHRTRAASSAFASTGAIAASRGLPTQGGSTATPLVVASGAASSAFASTGATAASRGLPTQGGSTATPLVVASGAASSVAAPHGTMEAQVAFLQSQLDVIGPNQVVLGMFRLLGSSHRRQGSESVVAFATGVHDHLGYAIKFFAARARFDAERSMYGSDALEPLAPKVEAVYDPDQSPDALTDRFGRALPPCIVMERGESLTEWSQRAKPDVFQAVAVLAHAAVRLRDMHTAGYVHRDVKPSNIMLLPRENRWTVIDFGCAAPIGQEAPLPCGLEYTSPENTHAAAAGVTAAAADPAMDAWALGVVAFEVLTGKRALSLEEDGADAVRAQLRGETLLPWEGGNLRSDMRRKLGIFREPVLGLLRRDPRERASMQAFCDTCNDLVTSSTTMVGQP